MKKLILFLAIVLLSIQTISEAQQNVTSCIGRKVNVYTKVDVPSIYKERSLLQKTASIYIQVVESTENPLPSAAREALDKAVDIWSYLIDSGQDITIYAEWIDIGFDGENGQGTLASCGPISFTKNFSGAPVQNKQYPIALAEAISNSNLNGSNYEITLSINSNSNIDWYTGTDGVPQENKFDLVSVLLHEIAHGLGYSDSFDNRNGLGSYGEPSEILEGYPTIYDQYCVVGSTHPSNDMLINYTQSSEVLAEKLTSENIYFDGHNTYLSNNNASAKLYAPAVWTLGSSIAHLDDDVFPASVRNSLMTHETNMAEVMHSPGEVGLSVLEDIGWSVNRLMIMIYPNEETTVTKGSTINIEWAENNSGNVDLLLFRIVSGIPQYETTINTGSLYSNRGENSYSWTIPSSPTEVPVGQYRIKLDFGGEGLSISEIFNISDQLQVATPDITPKSGTYTITQSVTITCSTANAQIYYTTNGIEPTTSSTLYNGVPFNATPPVTIKAKAFKSGYIASETAVEVYQYNDGIKVLQLDKNGISFGKLALWNVENSWNYFSSGALVTRHSTITFKAHLNYKTGTTEKFDFWIDNQDRTFFRNWEFINTSSSTKEIKAQFNQSVNAIVQNALEGFPSFNDGTISIKDPWKKDDFSDQAKGVRNRGSNALMNSYNSPLSITTGGEFMGVLLDQVQSSGTYYSVQALSTQQINGINASFVNWTATGADVPSPNSLETPIVFRQADAVVKTNYKGTHLSGNPSAFSNNNQNKFIKADGAMYQVYESMGRVWLERSTNNGSSWEILNNTQPIDVYNGRYPSLAHFDSGNQSVVVVYLDDAYGYQVRVKVFQNGSPVFEGVAGDYTYDFSVSSVSQPVAAYNYNGRLMVVWNHNGYLYYRYGQILSNSIQ